MLFSGCLSSPQQISLDARKSGNPSLCEQLSQHEKELCIIGVAEKTKNSNLCVNLIDSMDCRTDLPLFLTLLGQTQQPNLCETVSTWSFKDLCYQSVAKEALDSTLCDKISNQDMKDGCYYTLALALRDKEICKKIARVESNALINWTAETCSNYLS